jgi:hypothetical protein
MDLLNTEEIFVDFYQDDLCAMSDALQDKDDNDDVWYPTDDFDDYDSTSKAEPTISYLASMQSKLPPKSPMIYSTSTYITNNSIKPKPLNLKPAIAPPTTETKTLPSRDKTSSSKFSTLQVSNMTSSPIFRAQQKPKTDYARPLPTNQQFYAPPINHYYQQANAMPTTTYVHPMYMPSFPIQNPMPTYDSMPRSNPYYQPMIYNQNPNDNYPLYPLSPHDQYHINQQHQREVERQHNIRIAS